MGFGVGRPVAVVHGAALDLARWWSAFFRFGVADWCVGPFSFGPGPSGVPKGGSALFCRFLGVSLSLSPLLVPFCSFGSPPV